MSKDSLNTSCYYKNETLTMMEIFQQFWERGLWPLPPTEINQTPLEKETRETIEKYLKNHKM